LPFTTSLVEIKNFFSSCGEIVKVERQLDDKKRWTGSIFMKFDSSEGVDRALAMTGSVWSGTGGDGKRFVTVDKQDQKKSAKRRQKTKNGATHSVFIGNLQKKVERQQIQDLFVECGTINSIRFAKDGDGDCRGFGYIEFDTEEGKNQALKMNRRFNLDDNLVQVRKAQNNSTNQKPKKPEPVVKPKKAADGKVKAGGKKRPVADGGDKSAKKKTKSI
jgi:RNA recognition motif-containing protein